MVTGRVSSLALDPSDTTGNRLFVGTTGGGVWLAQNAAAPNAADIGFVPLTDNLVVMGGVTNASISIGALSVQPGGTGVVLAGTGDPNDALDSYYGAGILRSTDGGNTWNLIQSTGSQSFSFIGEGFAGFAWSTTNPQVVVAAVSQAQDSVLVETQGNNRSHEGLYFSTDSGATWSFAQITDLSGQVVQGPEGASTSPGGNAATSVVWNPVRNLFIAAVRYHGYYQSTDGSHWTRLAAQPGSGLTAGLCPTLPISTGTPACPMYRGTLAVNPLTGDTFAWTVDLHDQDQGIWQDVCAASSGTCTNQTVAFGNQWNSAPLETVTWLGSATIQNGTYNLALAAIPSDQDTLLLAGANDLWKCSLAMGCAWRNTTNATTCMIAQVGEYQHALEWNAANPLELFVGNDSGLWRSTDAVSESGPECSASDTSHFQNLNGGLGSLAEVESMSAVGASPYTMMVGLGANGTAGVKSTTAPTPDWPQIATGEGGPVAIDPANPSNWYVNNDVGVSIHACSQPEPCTPDDFGSTPSVSNANVNNDGLGMPWPAPFLIDPVDSSRLLIGTCRLWRGPADGKGWTSANAIGGTLDGSLNSTYCNGNALVQSLAAMAVTGGGEVVYVGTYGNVDPATLPGHVLSTTMGANGNWSAWQDLTLNPVVNDPYAMNAYGMGISSIYIDPHDLTGNTIYATIQGIPDATLNTAMAYRSIDGGGHWYNTQSNLPASAVNSLVVDPQDANTAYVATDAGVFVTQDITSCASQPACWSPFGSGLPNSPVIALSAAPRTTSPNVLVAGTFGRGVWQIPLITAGTQLTTATISPGSLDFGQVENGTSSSPQAVTLTNTGGVALLIGSVGITGAFSETDNCANATVNAGASCTIKVMFRPTQTGNQTGQLSVSANVPGATLSVDLSGGNPPAVNLSPATIDFGQVKVGSTSLPLSITAQNRSGMTVAIASLTVSGPFVVANNSCGAGSLGAGSNCQIQVEFAPSDLGPASGALTFVDDAGTQSVQLTGAGATPPQDSPSSVTFSVALAGQPSAPQTVTLTNAGGLPLASIAATVTGPFELTNNCGTQLAGHSNCVISAVFASTQFSGQTGILTVTYVVNAGENGTVPPAFSVNPASLSFGAQQVRVASAPLTLTVSNSGGSGLANVGFQISGSAASSFSTGTTTCGVSLDAGASCTVQVIFTPSASGDAAATLTISSYTLGVQSVAIPLSGIGEVTSSVQITPAAADFPNTGVGATSSPVTLTVSNSSTTVELDDLKLTTSAGFKLGNNKCAESLPPSTTCTVNVSFEPAGAGAQNGSLTLTSSALPAPLIVPLSGNGFDFQVTTSGSSNQTVSSGQTATYSFTLAPLGGTSATFVLQCGSLPSYAACTLSPSSVTVAADTTGTTTLSIATSQGSSSALRPATNGGWRVLPPVFAILLLPLAIRIRRHMAPFLLFLLLVAGLTACSSSGAPGTGTNPLPAPTTHMTPAGTYPIPVTVSSNGVEHSVTVTLVVD